MGVITIKTIFPASVTSRIARYEILWKMIQVKLENLEDIKPMKLMKAHKPRGTEETLVFLKAGIIPGPAMTDLYLREM